MGIWSRQWLKKLLITFSRHEQVVEQLKGCRDLDPGGGNIVVWCFCGGSKDDHKGSLLCLLHPHLILPGDTGPAHILVQKEATSYSCSPLQRRNARKGGLYVSPINVIKRIKLLEGGGGVHFPFI